MRYGPEFVAEAVPAMDRGGRLDRLHRAGEASWENGYIESFKGHLRDELLSRVGDITTIRRGPTPQSDTKHQHQRQRSSCPNSPRGWLRDPDLLRRPRSRNDQP